MKKLVEAEHSNRSKGRHEALKAARDRFYKGDIAVEMARFSEANGGLFRYEDFAEYSAEVETPVYVNYRGYQVYKNPSASQGPAELLRRIPASRVDHIELIRGGAPGIDMQGQTVIANVVLQGTDATTIIANRTRRN